MSDLALPNEIITDVAVGVIEQADGQILFGQRPEGKPWSGWWELPGGKLEPGETATEALKRELKEELGIEVTDSRPWVTRVHRYPTTTVRLAFHRVTGWLGEPRGLENQALRWLSPAIALQTEDLLPATYPPLRWLTFPEIYAISSVCAAQANEHIHTPFQAQSNAEFKFEFEFEPNITSSTHIVTDPATDLIAERATQIGLFLRKLERGLANGIKLLQWREPGWSNEDTLHEQTFKTTLSLCHQAGARVLVNSVHPQAWWHMADGVHLRQRDATSLQKRPELPASHWVAVSTHNTDELNHARDLEADFVTLSPVQATTSHPNAKVLGWPGFSLLQAQAGVPVYALGGLSPNDLFLARRFGAHGVAGIGQFLT